MRVVGLVVRLGLWPVEPIEARGLGGPHDAGTTDTAASMAACRAFFDIFVFLAMPGSRRNGCVVRAGGSENVGNQQPCGR